MLQEGMFYHSVYESNATTYHNVSSVHLRAPLETEVLRRCIERLVAGQTVLRTSFDLVNFARPLQLVHSSIEIPLVIDDLRRMSATEQEEFIREWVEAEKTRHFDWIKPPPHTLSRSSKK